jgi:AraC-like DNA-binding protein
MDKLRLPLVLRKAKEHEKKAVRPSSAPGGAAMGLVEFRDWRPRNGSELSFDEWESRLRSVCGRFQPLLAAGVKSVTGDVAVQAASGLDVARVSNNLDTIRRAQKDIRLDFGDKLFLLIQLEGCCGVEQYGRQSTIGSGDCVLLDSSSPLVIYFEGRFSDHLSVHLPRQLLLSELHTDLDFARRLGAEDPMSAVLRSLVAKLVQTSADCAKARSLRELLFQATRQSFARDSVALPALADGRLDAAQALIDRYLTEEYLSLDWLARRLGVSSRTLQMDFNRVGATVTGLIRMRRLLLARDRLLEMRHNAREATISRVAYAAGFNDISYFNRSFKEAFQRSPREFLRGRSRRFAQLSNCLSSQSKTDRPEISKIPRNSKGRIDK